MKFLVFMSPKCSLHSSQKPTIESYFQPDESSSHLHIQTFSDPLLYYNFLDQAHAFESPLRISHQNLDFISHFSQHFLFYEKEKKYIVMRLVGNMRYTEAPVFCKLSP
jgi:hypothetical protein